MDAPKPIVAMTTAINHRMRRLMAFSTFASLVAMACAALASAIPGGSGHPYPLSCSWTIANDG